MDARNQSRHLCAMPTIELTDIELISVVRGLRGMVRINLEDATRQQSPTTKKTFLMEGQFHQDLLERLEKAMSSPAKQRR